MASASPPGDNPQSYTTMSVGDVEAIGAHCQMAFCHQLDFLPFKCESCRGTFCLDHRTETTHKCSKAGAWARSRREASSTPSSVSSAPRPNILNHEQQCSSPVCKTLINTSLAPGIHCPDCNRQYCLKHRMREKHDCAKLTPLGARPGGTSKEKGLAALEKLRAWGASKKAAVSETAKKTSFGPKTNSPAARAAAINNLKKTAKGDAKISPEKRVYLHVEASADTTTAKYPTGNFFYNVEWSVGRILDMAAKELQVENVNNRGGGEKDRLRVFHVEGGRLLDFSEKIGKACQTGNTIVLLRGVGPPVPDLIEA
ncbi:AN1-type zinc finger protein 1 [Phyllosticta paracitricarpa]|uniref:AN1-type zinc finger protein 1 n=1 Tax=Phyllosticta paracitricarpa TaxID=2016321 RepID=A0ABR1N2Y1_9PEZI